MYAWVNNVPPPPPPGNQVYQSKFLVFLLFFANLVKVDSNFVKFFSKVGEKSVKISPILQKFPWNRNPEISVEHEIANTARMMLLVGDLQHT